MKLSVQEKSLPEVPLVNLHHHYIILSGMLIEWCEYIGVKSPFRMVVSEDTTYTHFDSVEGDSNRLTPEATLKGLLEFCVGHPHMRSLLAGIDGGRYRCVVTPHDSKCQVLISYCGEATVYSGLIPYPGKYQWSTWQSGESFIRFTKALDELKIAHPYKVIHYQETDTTTISNTETGAVFKTVNEELISLINRVYSAVGREGLIEALNLAQIGHNLEGEIDADIERKRLHDVPILMTAGAYTTLRLIYTNN